MTSLHSSCGRGRASPSPCPQSQSSTPGESVPPAFLKTALTAWDSSAALCCSGFRLWKNQKGKTLKMSMVPLPQPPPGAKKLTVMTLHCVQPDMQPALLVYSEVL